MLYCMYITFFKEMIIKPIEIEIIELCLILRLDEITTRVRSVGGLPVMGNVSDDNFVRS